jgi:hypothetical protein
MLGPRTLATMMYVTTHMNSSSSRPFPRPRSGQRKTVVVMIENQWATFGRLAGMRT